MQESGKTTVPNKEIEFDADMPALDKFTMAQMRVAYPVWWCQATLYYDCWSLNHEMEQQWCLAASRHLSNQITLVPVLFKVD